MMYITSENVKDNGAMVGFYLDDEEKRDILTILSNLKYFNGNKRKKLQAKLVVEDGNRIELYKGDKLFLAYLTTREASKVVSGIINWEAK